MWLAVTRSFNLRLTQMVEPVVTVSNRLPIYRVLLASDEAHRLSPQIIALNPQILERGHTVRLGIVPSPWPGAGIRPATLLPVPSKIATFSRCPGTKV